MHVRQLNATCIFAPCSKVILQMKAISSAWERSFPPWNQRGILLKQISLWPYTWCLHVSDQERRECHGAWGEGIDFHLLCNGPYHSLMKHSPLNFSKERVHGEQHHFPYPWSHTGAELMKILRKQGLLLYYGINPYNLKIFAWPVAIIKENLIVLLCI